MASPRSVGSAEAVGDVGGPPSMPSVPSAGTGHDDGWAVGSGGSGDSGGYGRRLQADSGAAPNRALEFDASLRPGLSNSGGTEEHPEELQADRGGELQRQGTDTPYHPLSFRGTDTPYHPLSFREKWCHTCFPARKVLVVLFKQRVAHFGSTFLSL